jgi:predicted patatin/cPLA2 family phospholipase
LLPDRIPFRYAPGMPHEFWDLLHKKLSGEPVGPVGLVVQGGGMRGIYSMAALAALEEMGFGSCFDHVAGSSAGALNGAYFITGQAAYGVETYIHFLSTRQFVNPWRRKKRVDIDYMIDQVLKQQRPLDLPRLREAPTTLHIPLTDCEQAVTHYVTNRTPDLDLWEAFRATAALPILYNRPVRIGQRLYLDGGLRDLIPLTRVLRAGCRYVIIILTQPLTHRSRRLRTALRAVGWRAARQYSAALRKALFSVDADYNRLMADLWAAAQGRNASGTRYLIIAPRSRRQLVTRMTIDSSRLLRCAHRARLDTWEAFAAALLREPPKTATFSGSPVDFR